MAAMNRSCRRLLAVWLLLAPALAAAQPERAAEKAARRQQMQLQALQQQIIQAQAGKASAEQGRTQLETQLRSREKAAASALRAQREASEKLQAAEAAGLALGARVAELEKALEAQRSAAEQALAGKEREVAQLALSLKAREGERDQWQVRFGEQVRLVTECGEKNDRLFKLNAGLIDSYRSKGVLDAIKQREPVLGLSNVQIFNRVQEYRDKAETERFTPSVEKR